MEFVQVVKSIIEIFTALLSPVIAISVAYIAYQQWKINSNKEKRESSAQKLHVYVVVKRFLRSIDFNREVDYALYDEFQEAVALADFLFNEDITNWLFDVDITASSWINLHDIILVKRNEITKNESTKINLELSELIDDLQNHHCQLLDVFKNSIVQSKTNKATNRTL